MKQTGPILQTGCLLFLVGGLVNVDAFQTHVGITIRTSSPKMLPGSCTETTTALHHSSNNDDSTFDEKILKQRLQNLHLEILEEELSRPPNANLSPIQVVEAIMKGLWHPYDPLPDAGFRLLLHTATPKWRKAIMNSVGAKSTDNYELVASALGSSIGRPHNQFAILVGEGEEYVLDFSSSEPLLDFGDGTCWVECHLRDKKTDQLLVITGWDLVTRDDDGAWMVDWIHWVDFRDEFRPGIGREEWLVEA
jgi:hypothetical protein